MKLKFDFKKSSTPDKVVYIFAFGILVFMIASIVIRRINGAALPPATIMILSFFIVTVAGWIYKDFIRK